MTGKGHAVGSCRPSPQVLPRRPVPGATGRDRDVAVQGVLGRDPRALVDADDGGGSAPAEVVREAESPSTRVGGSLKQEQYAKMCRVCGHPKIPCFVEVDCADSD